MSAVDKIIYGAFALFVIVSLLYYANLYGTVQKQKAEIALLHMRLTECAADLRGADVAIEKQNAAIEAVRVDTVRIVERVHRLSKAYTNLRAEIVERIERDSSCENKFKIIDGLMRDFHGVRAEGHDED